MNIALYTRPNDTLELFVIHIYQTGLTTSKISDLVERIYGIVNMTKQRFL
nr:transposase [Geomicrobium sediminis]